MRPVLLAILSLQFACIAPEPRGTQPLSPEATHTPDATTLEVHQETESTESEKEDLLMKALRSLTPDEPGLGNLRVLFDFEDLNTDGSEEAVVHVISPEFCGSGGCTTLVYQWDPEASTYTKINHFPTTRPPIYSSRQEGCRWSMLWVQRSGGGLESAGPSPVSLSEDASCEAPVAPWKESKSKLLIPADTAESEGVRP